MSVTLLVFPYLLATNRADLRWTISICLICSLLWGFQIVQQLADCAAGKVGLEHCELGLRFGFLACLP